MRSGFALLACLLAATAACDVGQFTVNTTSKVLERAQPGIQQESDYEMARQAIPGALKTVEGFWVVDPSNERLIKILTEGYCQYGTAFVEDDWEVAKLAKKLDDVAYQNARATHIFTRCLNYALMQLGDDFSKSLFSTPEALAKQLKEIGPGRRTALMWAALALGSIINHNLTRVEMISYLSSVKLMLDRVLELDAKSLPDDPQKAALPHVAYGMIFSAASAQLGGNPERAKQEFELALKLTATKDVPNGRLLLARTLLGYRVGLMTNDQKLFHEQLKQVLETSPAVWPEQRLANEVAHRRARRYLSHEKDFFQ